ncbi:MAG: DUF3224 domain-containing protein [Polyangiaceae bacterium]
MIGKGTFDVTLAPETQEELDGIIQARIALDKRFRGALEGKSKATMLSARTAISGSAGYVALERIEGVLEGRAGSFVVLHMGLMNRGAASLTLEIVPDSATGELAGLRGTMRIDIVDGKHHYEIDYTLG